MAINVEIKTNGAVNASISSPQAIGADMQGIANGGGSPFSVLFVEQQLTDEQKAQARANIGVEDIPEWALEEEKPTYTADEVGAIAQEDLQKAVNIALQQAQASGKFDGEDGVSVVSVRQTTTSSADGGSNVITVTLSNGQTSTFTVKNGSKGSQGAQGVKGDKGDRGLQGVKGDTGAQGAKGDKGDAGADGKNGADGYTPVKGKDYYTDADKAEMVQAVLAALPSAEGVGF